MQYVTDLPTVVGTFDPSELQQLFNQVQFLLKAALTIEAQRA